MRKNWFRRRVILTLLGVSVLCLIFGLLASASAANYQPISDEQEVLVELGLEVGESKTFKTNFTLLVDEVEADFSEAEIILGPPSFTVPDTARTRELLQGRTYFEDEYWCSYPEDKDYRLCGPMDGSQYYCQYFEGADPVCFNDFSQ